MEPGVPALPHAADGPDEESHGGGREEARVVPLRRRLPVLFFSLGLIFFSWPDFFLSWPHFFLLAKVARPTSSLTGSLIPALLTQTLLLR